MIVIGTMTIIGLLILLALIGVVAWVLTAYVPMPPAMKTLIIVAAVTIGVILVCNALGLFNFNEPVPQISH